MFHTRSPNSGVSYQMVSFREKTIVYGECLCRSEWLVGNKSYHWAHITIFTFFTWWARQTLKNTEENTISRVPGMISYKSIWNNINQICTSNLWTWERQDGGTRKKDLFALKWEERKGNFSYYSKCKGSPRMLKLGDTKNLTEHGQCSTVKWNAKMSKVPEYCKLCNCFN